MLTLFGFVFCTVNSFIQYASLYTGSHTYEVETLFFKQLLNARVTFDLVGLSGLRIIFGIALFMMGMYINISSDNTLLKMKHSSNKNYKIPTGGFFAYVSCAHYFGEIIEWFGYALACASLPALAFAIFTFSYLSGRAINSHAYYNTRFKTYPKNRKAIIPFIL